MFKASYDRGLSVDAFPVFAAGVWETIRTEKELDIPAQKELVAVVRCDDYKETSIQKADEAFREIARDLASVSRTCSIQPPFLPSSSQPPPPSPEPVPYGGARGRTKDPFPSAHPPPVFLRFTLFVSLFRYCAMSSLPHFLVPASANDLPSSETCELSLGQ